MNLNAYKNVMNRIEIDSKCKEEIFKTMDKKQQKKVRIRGKKFFPIGIAIALLTCTGTAVCAEKFGVFDRLKEKENRTWSNEYGEYKIDKFDNNNYELIGQNATDIAEPETVFGNNLSVSIESIYCDGARLVIGLSGTLDKPENIECADRLLFDAKLDIGGNIYQLSKSSDDERICDMSGNMILDENSENTYTGTITLTLQPECRITESVQADILISDIICQGFNYEEYGTIDDEISLHADIIPDLSKIQELDKYIEEDGFKFAILESSPSMISVATDYPEWYDTNTEEIEFEEGGNILTGPKYSIVALFYDENGEMMSGLPVTDLPEYNDDMIHGFLSSSDTSTITVKFCNKQNDLEVIKELTLDLSE